MPQSETRQYEAELLAEAKRLLELGTSNSLMAHERRRWLDDRERLCLRIDAWMEE